MTSELYMCLFVKELRHKLQENFNKLQGICRHGEYFPGLTLRMSVILGLCSGKKIGIKAWAKLLIAPNKKTQVTQRNRKKNN